MKALIIFDMCDQHHENIKYRLQKLLIRYQLKPYEKIK